MAALADQPVHGSAVGYSGVVSVRSSETGLDLLVLTVAHLRIHMSDWPMSKGSQKGREHGHADTRAGQ